MELSRLNGRCIVHFVTRRKACSKIAQEFRAVSHVLIAVAFVYASTSHGAVLVYFFFPELLEPFAGVASYPEVVSTLTRGSGHEFTMDAVSAEYFAFADSFHPVATFQWYIVYNEQDAVKALSPAALYRVSEKTMIATIINALAIVLGTAIGLLVRKGFSQKAREAIYAATGVISLVIGFSMAITTEHVLAFALAIIAGGLLGTALDIEGAIYRLGEWLRKRFSKKSTTLVDTPVSGSVQSESSGFAYGFLNASVLFCVGAMALVGSFKAGAEGDYDLILTKSVMDGVIAIVFAGAMGIGVGFSALSVLVYQGLLTLGAAWVKPFVTGPMIAELSAVGGALVVMIGINLLGLKKIRTGDFLPALVIIVVLSFLFKYISVL